MKISVVVLTKNEEKNIAECLRSLSFCDEIVVIDDYSRDDTVEIAKKQKAKVFQRAISGDFAAQRNFGLEKAKGEWVLFIDADERISQLLAGEIQLVISLPTEYNGFYIVRRDILWGRELRYGEVGRAGRIRLGKKESGHWVGKVHERFVLKGKIGTLQSLLVHYPHQTITEFIGEINYYTTIRAKELHSKGVKTSYWQIILYPAAKFFQNYIFKLGFLDGVPGLIVALMMSFHSFLVRGKLWSLRRKI